MRNRQRTLAPVSAPVLRRTRRRRVSAGRRVAGAAMRRDVWRRALPGLEERKSSLLIQTTPRAQLRAGAWESDLCRD